MKKCRLAKRDKNIIRSLRAEARTLRRYSTLHYTSVFYFQRKGHSKKMVAVSQAPSHPTPSHPVDPCWSQEVVAVVKAAAKVETKLWCPRSIKTNPTLPKHLAVDGGWI